MGTNNLTSLKVQMSKKAFSLQVGQFFVDVFNKWKVVGAREDGGDLLGVGSNQNVEFGDVVGGDG